MLSKALEQVIVLVVFCVVLKRSFIFFPPFVLGCKSVRKIKHDHFSVHGDSLLVLSYVSVLLFSPFTCFSNPHAPTLVSGMLVKAGLPLEV